MSAKMLLMSFAVLCLATTVLSQCTEFDEECCKSDLNIFKNMVAIGVECGKMPCTTEAENNTKKACESSAVTGILDTKYFAEAMANNCLTKKVEDMNASEKKCCEGNTPLITDCTTRAAQQYMEEKEDEK